MQCAIFGAGSANPQVMWRGQYKNAHYCNVSTAQAKGNACALALKRHEAPEPLGRHGPVVSVEDAAAHEHELWL